MKYRKKPVVIEAIKWDGNFNEIKSFCPLVIRIDDKAIGFNCLSISTLEGQMIANFGDWIIKGIAGEFYPCKNEVFQQSYEKSEE